MRHSKTGDDRAVYMLGMLERNWKGNNAIKRTLNFLVLAAVLATINGAKVGACSYLLHAAISLGAQVKGV